MSNVAPSGRIIVYGGFFGNTLLTEEHFVKTWNEHTAQILRLADTAEEIPLLREALRPVHAMIARKQQAYITEAEAREIGVALHRKG